eukprot:CAMPEP_0195523812 /NCGR_PEP_ID=MMETSP0794_2-20130614/23250_1 /TAXON_ID=515487 /ORGANISM="Stephanopyxis turris, Strain CCMP 815" /LENGTH=616 /DNA_ID=CAMNT_0040653889 /DNA_START=261 /DNA_END=2111 /DNA_ORIENTATION=-
MERSMILAPGDSDESDLHRAPNKITANNGNNKNVDTLPDANELSIMIKEQKKIIKDLGYQLQDKQPKEYQQVVAHLKNDRERNGSTDLNTNVKMSPLPTDIVYSVGNHRHKIHQLKNELSLLVAHGNVSRQKHPFYFDRLKVLEEQQHFIEDLQTRFERNQGDMEERLKKLLLPTNNPGTSSMEAPVEQNEARLNMLMQKLLKSHEEQKHEQLKNQQEQKQVFLDAQKHIDPQKQLGLEQLQEQQQKQTEKLRVQQQQEKQDLRKQEEARQQQGQLSLKDLRKLKEAQSEIDQKKQGEAQPQTEQNQAPSPKEAPVQSFKLAPRFPDMSGYKYTWDPLKPTDLPVLWHVPESDSVHIGNILRVCYSFCMASDAGIANGHHKDTEIAVVIVAAKPGHNPSPFVNVDVTTSRGIVRAQRMGFAQAGLANVMVTPLIHEANILFDSSHKGRLFAMFEHPVDRAIRIFRRIQKQKPELGEMSIEEYAQSDYVENNWLVRQLSKRYLLGLDERHLEMAMDKVRRNILVGLSSRGQESMERFEKFFRWEFSFDRSHQQQCRENMLETGVENEKKLEPESEAYQLLAQQNELDIRLYSYIETLFDEQVNFIAKIPEDPVQTAA